MDYYGAKELAESFRTVRKNTIRTAEDIPEDKYDFRATPDTRTVAQTLAHIAIASGGAYQSHAVDRIQTFVGVDFAALIKAREEQASQLTSKPQILEALRDSGETWARYLGGVTEPALAERVTFSPDGTPPSKSRFEMLLSVKEQEMHGRAQLMLIQRMLGIVPHLTREREARMAEAANKTTPGR